MSSEYFKIIDGGNVIGVGHMFLKWFARAGRYGYCRMEEAGAVEDAVTGTIYRPSWMPAAPEADFQPSLVESVRFIDITEYDELYEELSDGETIPEPEDDGDGGGGEPTPEDGDDGGAEPDQERPMTVQEIREAVAMLTECILEMSEVVYGE